MMASDISPSEDHRYTIHVTPVDQDYFAEVPELCSIEKGATAEKALQNLGE